jgi:hypothetical protein
MLEKVSKYASLVAAYMIMCGLIRLIVYYDEFGINITSFLDLSEVLTSFMDIVVPFIFISIIIIVATFAMLSVGELTDAREAMLRLQEKVSFWQRAKLFFRAQPFITYYALGEFLARLPAFGIESALASLLINTLIFLLLVLKVQLEAKYKSFTGNRIAAQNSNVLFLAIVFMFASGLWGAREASMVKRELRNYGVRIEFNDGKVRNSNSFQYFIGRTGKYLFIYTPRTKVSEVFSISDIRYMQIPKARSIFEKIKLVSP